MIRAVGEQKNVYLCEPSEVEEGRVQDPARSLGWDSLCCQPRLGNEGLEGSPLEKDLRVLVGWGG